MGYCTHAELYNYGLPGGTLSRPGRLVADVTGTTPTTIITLEGHALATGQPVQFRAEGGGALPAGLTAGVQYYVTALTGSTLTVSATFPGSAISMTPPVTSMLLIADPPIDEWIEWASAMVDQFLPAHAVPLVVDDNGDYPTIVVAVTADLAAARGTQWCGTTSVNMQNRLEMAQKLLDKTFKGIPLRGQGSAAQTSTNCALVRKGINTDPRGWGTGGIG